MLTKALWMKEYKQAKTLIWVLLGIFFFDFPIRVSQELENWRQMEKESAAHHFDFVVDEWMVGNLFSGGFSSLFVLVVVVLLAGLLIGAERNSRKNDFSFALPYKRSQLFLTKWLLGIAAIVLFYSVNYFIAYFIVSASEYGQFLENFSLLNMYFMPLAAMLTMYSFALLIGTISGEMISQMVLTFIFTFFPVGFFYLIYGFFTIHTGGGHLSYPDFLESLIWPLYILQAPYNTNLTIAVPLVATVLFTVVATWLYTINKAEHNGEFLIFKQLQPIFRVGIIVCFALLGGITIAGLSPYYNESMMRIVFYWIGFITFGYLSYVLTNRLLAMNVKVKNK